MRELMDRCLRVGLLVSLSVTAVAALGVGVRPARAGTLSDRGDSLSPQTALRLGKEAVHDGRLIEADTWLRAAWTSPSTRPVATRALRQLHETPGFQLPVDEAQVQRVAATLGRSFRRSETDHFVMLSDTDARWTRSRNVILERTRHEFYRFATRLGSPVIPHERKLLVVLFDDYERYRVFAHEQDDLDASWVAGYYSIANNMVVFYNDLSGPSFVEAFATLDGMSRAAGQTRSRARREQWTHNRSRAVQVLAGAEAQQRMLRDRRRGLEKQAEAFSTAKTVHEAVHLLSFNAGLQRADRFSPFWLSEGLATNFETDRPTRAFGPDIETSVRHEAFGRFRDTGQLLPLDELITLDELPDETRYGVEALYAQSHALVAYLYQHRRRALGEYIEALGSMPAVRPTPAQHRALFERYFGPVGAIEGKLERW